MPYEFSIEERPTYVHAKVVADRSAANALRFLEDAYAACVKSGRSSLLLEMHLAGGSLTTTSVYNVISQRVPDGRQLGKIAYVDTSPDQPAMAHFAETVAINRGVNVRLFPNVAAAEEWLLSEKDQ
jgi:hypothetical protein